MPPFNLNPPRTLSLARGQLFRTTRAPARKFLSTDAHSTCDSKLQPVIDEQKSLRNELEALKNRRGLITRTATKWRDGWREYRRYGCLPRDIVLGLFSFMTMFNLTDLTMETMRRKEAARVATKKESE